MSEIHYKLFDGDGVTETKLGWEIKVTGQSWRMVTDGVVSLIGRQYRYPAECQTATQAVPGLKRVATLADYVSRNDWKGRLMGVTYHRLDTVVDGQDETKIVAFRQLEVVGTIGLQYAGRRSASIRQLFVDPKYRKGRVGSELVARACAIATEGKCKTLGLILDHSNRSTEGFYYGLGFFAAYEYSSGDLLLTCFLGGSSVVFHTAEEAA